MPIPTWVPGEVLAAADVNAWFVPLAVVKPGATSRASTTTTTADPDLTLTVSASATYIVSVAIGYDGAASGFGFLKFDFIVPSGSFTYEAIYEAGGGVIASPGVVLAGTPPPSNAVTTGTGAPNGQGLQIKGTLAVGETGGAFAFSWAQGVTNSTATRVYAQSFMMLQRVA